MKDVGQIAPAPHESIASA